VRENLFLQIDKVKLTFLSVYSLCKPCSLVEYVAPRTGKIINNRLNVFERGENLKIRHKHNILHLKS